MMAHVKNKHQHSQSDFAGTYFLEKYRDENNAAQKHRRLNPKPKQAARVKAEPESTQDGEAVPAAAPAAAAPPAADPVPPPAMVEHWKQMAVWVRCTAAGVPVSPLTCSLHPPQAPEVETAAAEAVAEVATAAAEAVVEDAVAAAEAGDKRALGVVPAQQAAAQGEGLGRVTALLEQLVAQQAEGDTWAQALPKIAIKEAYTTCECPTPSKAGERTGKWPVRIQSKDTVELSSFTTFLVDGKNLKQGSAQLEDMRRAMTRTMHMLLVNGAPITEERTAVDLDVWVALYTSGCHTKLLNLEILKHCYGWTRRVIDAMKLYTEFQVNKAAVSALDTGDARYKRYKTALELLLKDIIARTAKRLAEEKTRREQAKYKADYNVLNAFPPVSVVKDSVLKAMRCLQMIHAQTADLDATPPATMGIANACVVFIIASNGFMGRVQEWSLAKLAHFQTQTEAGLDYLECNVHKTAKHYGDIAKWLAPGTHAALSCYAALPRLASVDTLLHPAGAAKVVDIPNALRNGNRLFLPKDSIHPRSTQWRKWYHSKLTKLVESEAGLAEVFRRIDGHSANVQRKVYVLKGPREDAKLAQHIVELGLGTTVPWPTDQAEKSLEELLEEILSNAEAPVDEDDAGAAAEEEDAEPMPDAVNMQLFAAPEFLLPLPGPEEAVLAIQDGEVLEQGEEGGAQEAAGCALALAACAPSGSRDKCIPLPRQPAASASGEAPDASDAPMASTKRPRSLSPEVPHRGRKSPFNATQRNWIFEERRKRGFEQFAPPNIVIKDILAEGLRSGALPEGTNEAQVRQLCR